jgi:ribosomal protein S18 acetylase RimI-like enzyme
VPVEKPLFAGLLLDACALVGLPFPRVDAPRLVLPSTTIMSADGLVRDFRRDDAPAVRACIVALQDYERQIDPRLRPGASMADEYLTQTLARCSDFGGRIFICEDAGAVAGFITVLTRMPFLELDDPPGEYALVTDLVVLERFRRRGFGRALLDAAERYARDQGARELRIGVLSANHGAKRLYGAAGFGNHAEVLAKRFDRDDSAAGES